MFAHTKRLFTHKNLANFSIDPNQIIKAALLISLIIVLLSALYFFIGRSSSSGSHFMRTADQLGQQLYSKGDYNRAADSFLIPEWRAAALYRAGNFKDAAAIYAGGNTVEAHYNYGNSLVMQGKYQQAVEQYDQALSLQPGLQEAITNRDIALLRAEQVKQEGGDMTGGMLGADEIIFTKGKASSEQSEDVVETTAQNEAEMRAIWLRQVQTRPADFLKAKFAYQLAIKKDAP
jgi:Ca-activated chloride channel homolog